MCFHNYVFSHLMTLRCQLYNIFKPMDSFHPLISFPSFFFIAVAFQSVTESLCFTIFCLCWARAYKFQYCIHERAANDIHWCSWREMFISKDEFDECCLTYRKIDIPSVFEHFDAGFTNFPKKKNHFLLYTFSLTTYGYYHHKQFPMSFCCQCHLH